MNCCERCVYACFTFVVVCRSYLNVFPVCVCVIDDVFCVVDCFGPESLVCLRFHVSLVSCVGVSVES